MPTVAFAAFDPATHAVAFDIAPLFAGTNFDSADGGGAPGCMSGETPANPATSDPECAPIFSGLGLPFNGAAAGAQTAFRVVAK